MPLASIFFVVCMYCLVPRFEFLPSVHDTEWASPSPEHENPRVEGVVCATSGQPVTNDNLNVLHVFVGSPDMSTGYRPVA